MLSLPITAPAGRPLRLLCLGAHADDAEIGAAGTVLGLLRDVSVDVRWAVASARGDRDAEARASAADLLQDAASTDVVLGSFEDGFLPYDPAAVKRWVHELAVGFEPDVVLTHHRRDLHQDHRFIAELALNAFRDQLILGFEIPKYDGDMGPPNVYVPLDDAAVERKIEMLRRHFESQHGKPWFDDDLFRGLMRLRGMESRSASGYAEAFYGDKLVIGLA